MDTASQLKKGHFIGAIFLVAGTCIGGGILALPLLTGLAGFLPSSLMLLLCWLFMTSTGLLYLEVNIWLGSDIHIIGMARRLLGPIGKAISILVYLFICYTSLVAYISGGGGLLVEAFKGINISLHV